MKRKLAVLIVCFLLPGLIFGVSVETLTVVNGELFEKLTFSGEIKPYVETYVTADVNGFVKEVLVDNGKQVQKNEVMIVLDPTRYNNAVRQRSALLKINQQAAKEAQSEMERSRILIEKKVINQKSYEKTETLYIQAQSSLEQAQAAYDLSRLDLERCRIRSIIDGYYVNRNVFEGQAVSAAAVLGKVIDLSKVYVEVKIPENKIQLIKLEQECSIEETCLGKVSHIDLYADRTRSFLVKILMENKDLAFKANMFVKGHILVNHFRDVPLIPASSLIYEDGKYSVFIIQEGKAVKKDLEIIAREGEFCYAKGVLTGDVLVVTGQFSLKDGIDVSVVEKANP